VRDQTFFQKTRSNLFKVLLVKLCAR